MRQPPASTVDVVWRLVLRHWFHPSDYSEHKQMDKFEEWYGLECVECGSCSYVCPARRPLAQSVKTMKKFVLAEKRKKN